MLLGNQSQEIFLDFCQKDGYFNLISNDFLRAAAIFWSEDTVRLTVPDSIGVTLDCVNSASFANSVCDNSASPRRRLTSSPSVCKSVGLGIGHLYYKMRYFIADVMELPIVPITDERSVGLDIPCRRGNNNYVSNTKDIAFYFIILIGGANPDNIFVVTLIFGRPPPRYNSAPSILVYNNIGYLVNWLCHDNYSLLVIDWMYGLNDVQALYAERDTNLTSSPSDHVTVICPLSASVTFAVWLSALRLPWIVAIVCVILNLLGLVVKLTMYNIYIIADNVKLR
jgi:hypothetical protein